MKVSIDGDLDQISSFLITDFIGIRNSEWDNLVKIKKI